MAHRWVAQCVLVCAVLQQLLQAQAGPVRGVEPSSLSSYLGTNGLFTCLDGSATIPLSRVNDNYCDCASDGSDEPGTSACYYGKFYCANKGFEPKHLASAFVDDGICDCCDGADEKPGVCKNTCLEKGAAERQAIRDRVAAVEASLAKKTQLTYEATAKKIQWSTRSATIFSELATAKQQLQQLEEAQKVADAEAEAERERVTLEQEAARQQRAAEEEAARQQRAAEEEAARAAGIEEGAVQEEVVVDAGAGAGSEPEQHEETDEERGRRIASQWTHDPAAAVVPEAGHGGDSDFQQEVEDHAHHGDGHEDMGEEYESQPYEAPEDDHEPYYPPASMPASDAALATRAALNQARSLVQQLEKEEQDISLYHSSQQAFDWGPGEVFLPLAGRCLTDQGTRWHYEACFFQQAVQREPHGANPVSLGRWVGFKDNYSKAVFEGGDACAGAPPRSFTVNLVCGDDEVMWGGEEPSTCVYQAWMRTPAACRESDLEKERQQLAELERFEAEVRAEIEADERAAASNAHSEL